MKLRLTITGLAVLLSGLAAAPPAPPAKSGPAPASKAPLFIGTGVPWLPKVKTLPSAADVERLAEKLSSRERNVDPFGVAPFPREDSAPVFEDEGIRPAKRITLNQALQTLKLNAVNVGQKEFLIGGRSVFQGDVIELSYRDELFQALVVEVGATQITFRDLKRDESGVMPHNMIPHLHLEPMRNVTSALETRLAPMEPASPPTPSPSK